MPANFTARAQFGVGGSPAKAKATTPEIPFEAVPNFIKMPAGLYLGDSQNSGNFTATAGPTANGSAQTYTAPASGSSATVMETSVDNTSVVGTASVTIVAAASVTGRLLGGVLVTKLSSKAFTAVLMLVQGAALASFAFASTAPSIIVTCIVFGLSVGNLLMLQPLLMAEAFGVREYSRIYSMASLIMTIGVGLHHAQLGMQVIWEDYTSGATRVAISVQVAGTR